LDSRSPTRAWSHDVVTSLGQLVTRFAQVLTSRPEALFGLFQHEATGPLRALREETRRDGVWRKPWIRTAPIPLPRRGHRASWSVEVQSQYRLAGRHAAALAGDASIAFYLKTLGEIAIVRVDSGREDAATLRIRPLRVLKMAASPDAIHVALAFDSSEIDVLRVDVLSDSHSTIATLSYFMPEVEAPVLYWEGATLWYQSARDRVARFSAQVAQPAYIPLSTAGELSAAAGSAGHLVAAIRQSGGSVLVAIADASVTATREVPQLDITCMDQCGPGRIVFGASDLSVRIVTVPDLRDEARVSSPELPLTVGGSESSVIWASDRGHYFAWDCATTSHAIALGDAEISSYGPRPLWIGLAEGVTTAVSESRVVRFARSRSTGTTTLWPVERALVLEDGSVAVAQRRNEDLWLVDPGNEREVSLGPDVSAGLLAVDGQSDVLALSSSGRCVYVDWRKLTPTRLDGIPPGVTAVAAGGKGFWVVRRDGSILFLDRTFTLSEVGGVALGGGMAAGALAWPGWLLVRGIGVVEDWQVPAGEDTNEFLVLFRLRDTTPPSLARRGSRVFLKHEGFVQGMACDEENASLVVLMRRNGDRVVRAHVGTADAFIQRSETVRAIECSDAVSQVTGMGSSMARGWLILHGGALSYLDSASLRTRAVLTVAAPITTIASNGRDVAIVESHTRVFRCQLSLGGRS